MGGTQGRLRPICCGTPQIKHKQKIAQKPTPNSKPANVKVILLCLDRILDYLPIEDLCRATAVNKFFCYTATMERLYDKFRVEETESFVETELNALTEDWKSEQKKGKLSKKRMEMMKTDGVVAQKSKERDDLLRKSNISNVTLKLLRK
ncbi:unnamed protein product [Moneuplotes crassus]|uniref:F-box domain-containing protein n=1 Tax=Euplotes crassus TaxID=5936 RepID=A0AAD1U4A9_EUPCR|nr:unnamed protein product [Moneuplotes crassus]